MHLSLRPPSLSLFLSLHSFDLDNDPAGYPWVFLVLVLVWVVMGPFSSCVISIAAIARRLIYRPAIALFVNYIIFYYCIIVLCIICILYYIIFHHRLLSITVSYLSWVFIFVLCYSIHIVFFYFFYFCFSRCTQLYFCIWFLYSFFLWPNKFNQSINQSLSLIRSAGILTQTYALLTRARTRARKLCFRYVWLRARQVAMKRAEGQPIIYINTLYDIKRLA